jgi:hypothetical protein
MRAVAQILGSLLPLALLLPLDVFVDEVADHPLIGGM